MLGILGPLEAPGLMLHGVMTAWADTVERALWLVLALSDAVHADPGLLDRNARPEELARTLRELAARGPKKG